MGGETKLMAFDPVSVIQLKNIKRADVVRLETEYTRRTKLDAWLVIAHVDLSMWEEAYPEERDIQLRITHYQNGFEVGFTRKGAARIIDHIFRNQ